MSNYHVRAMKIAPPEWLSLNAVQSYRLGQNAAAEIAAQADAEIAELECENKQLEARLDDLRNMFVSCNSEIAWEIQESKRLSAELESARAGESAALERVAEMAGLLASACCPNCDGSGAFLVHSRESATREMAIDAEDESLEGALYRTHRR